MSIERKLLFNEVVEDYAAARPDYPAALLEDAIQIAGLTEQSRILEVGCGTGQGSKLFVEAGQDVTAIEIGDKLCAYVQKRFAEKPNFRVVHQNFEEFVTETRYDLVFSASAFHWIAPEIGYPKAQLLLKEGGYLLLAWNSRSERKSEEPVFQAINAVYERLFPPRDASIHKQEERLRQIRESGCFTEPLCYHYPYERKMTTEGYIQLLGTYSDHIALESDIRTVLFNEIRKIINAYGGEVVVPYEVQAYFAQRLP